MPMYRKLQSISPQTITVLDPSLGIVATKSRLLGISSLFSVIAGSNSNLGINAVTGAVYALTAIVGTQVAYTREQTGTGLAVEAPITFVSTGTTTPVLLANPVTGTTTAAPAVSLYRDSVYGTYSTTFSISSIIPTITTVVYMDPVNGVDANSGLTTALPKKSLSAALVTANVDQVQIINLTSDFIAKNTAGFNNTQATRSISVLVNSSNGYRFISVTASTAATLTWAVNSTYSNVYQAALTTAPYNMVDLGVKSWPFYLLNGGTGYLVNDQITLGNGSALTVTGANNGSITNWTFVSRATSKVSGVMTATGGTGRGAAFQSVTTAGQIYDPLILVSSIALCSTTAGSYYYDGSTTVYVNPTNARSLVGDTFVTPLSGTGANGRFGATTAGLTLYVQGVDFVGGGTAFKALTSAGGNTGTVAFNNCTFQSSSPAAVGNAVSGTNGLAVQGLLTVYTQNCGAYWNYADGFNFHSFTSTESSNAANLGQSPTTFQNGDCALGNGMTGSTGTSDNAFTAHDWSNNVLLNCIACNSSDRPFAYVYSSRVWALGCLICPADTILAAKETYSIQNYTSGWLDGCKYIGKSANPNFDVERNGAVGTLYYRNMVINAADCSTGSYANIAAY